MERLRLDIDRALLERSWSRAWLALGATPTTAWFDEVITRYREPQRSYHTLQHLDECIRWLEPVLGLAEAPGEVEIALWFHDAVYEPKRSDNEDESARLAQRALAAGGVTEATIARVCRFIMVTQHAALPSTPDEQLIVDIDLAILGAAEARFAEYEAQIRREYNWVPGWLFRRKRKAILREFIARAPLYGTACFHDRLEAQARRNLARAIGVVA